MNELVKRLEGIKKHLSNRETWERFHNISEAGYNLANDLGGLWCCYYGEDKKYYPIAYACVSRAIRDLFEERVTNDPMWKKLNIAQLEGIYQPDLLDVKRVFVFENCCNFDEFISVMDLSIHYAQLWIFS